MDRPGPCDGNVVHRVPARPAAHVAMSIPGRNHDPYVLPGPGLRAVRARSQPSPLSRVGTHHGMDVARACDRLTRMAGVVRRREEGVLPPCDNGGGRTRTDPDDGMGRAGCLGRLAPAEWRAIAGLSP